MGVIGTAGKEQKPRRNFFRSLLTKKRTKSLLGNFLSVSCFSPSSLPKGTTQCLRPIKDSRIASPKNISQQFCEKETERLLESPRSTVLLRVVTTRKLFTSELKSLLTRDHDFWPKFDSVENSGQESVKAVLSSLKSGFFFPLGLCSELPFQKEFLKPKHAFRSSYPFREAWNGQGEWPTFSMKNPSKKRDRGA